MKPKKVVAFKNLPSRLPLWQTLTWFLTMERFNAPQWLWGCLGLLFVFFWCESIYGICTQEKVDILNGEKKPE